MKTVTIEGQLRTEVGKKATRQLRSQEMVPGVIYGGAKEIAFATPAKALKSLVYTSEFLLAEINVSGTTYRCILKDLQFDKVSDELIHLDLLELVDDKKVIATLPIKYTGTAIGVKEGGKLVLKIKSLKVKTLPKDLKEFISIDPKIPDSEKEFIPSEKLRITTEDSREKILDTISGHSVYSELSQLALYIYRQMDKIDWQIGRAHV